jgi:GntR family transcriptional regulator, rspAB operon transcriptional repressor
LALDAAMAAPSAALLRRSQSRSTERLDPDRQAAPQVYDRLRELITSLSLPPGSALSRVALAEQFGLSSTPIRDALMRLHAEGLVEVFPQYATVVSRIDVELAQQAHFLRLALELEMVRTLALQASAELVHALNHAIALQQGFAKMGDFESFSAADSDFHRHLYAATGKHGLWDLVRSRSGHIDRLRRLHLPTPGKAQEIVRYHKLVVQAIGAGQPEEAQSHLRRHLSGTLAYLDAIRARFPDYLKE